MTSERQRAANRANATKSTGPKSPGGKATASQNARKHGLTAPPAASEVLRWGRILLGDAQASAANLAAQPLEVQILAEAEARLERAWTAERACLAELMHEIKLRGERDPTKLSLDDIENPAVLEFLLRSPKDDLDKEAIAFLLSLWRPTVPPVLARLRRIQRYVTAAERARARAFAAWLATRRGAA